MNYMMHATRVNIYLFPSVIIYSLYAQFYPKYYNSKKSVFSSRMKRKRDRRKEIKKDSNDTARKSITVSF